MDLQTIKASWAVEFVDIEKAAMAADAWWEPHQITFLNNQTRFGIDSKARQIAWSFTAALDAVADSILNDGTPHVFVSINLDEAKEKIRYARAVIDATDAPMRPGIIRDNATSIEFNNGSRLISHPCKPIRGKARTRVYLDEMAHYKAGLDREIYTAALPATTRGDGYLRIGSSPLGASGMFWEIFTESMRPYPGYNGHRRMLPWWTVQTLSRDVKRAIANAGSMPTEARVYEFGTRPLIEIFENMFLEDFQQEYECAWIDESTAWITWATIKKNQELHDGVWYHATSVDEAMRMIPLVIADIDQGIIENVLTGGIDVGRTHDLTEFAITGKSDGDRHPLRFSISLENVGFDDQEACLCEIINTLPISCVLVDKNGIGMQLAENLEMKTGKAQGVDFTNATKELWAVEARVQAGRGNTPLPTDRDTAYQIHSIKKFVTSAKNNRFDTERNEKHHADKFWAWALSIWAAGKSGPYILAI